MSFRRLAPVLLVSLMLLVVALACTSNEVTETITEAELNEDMEAGMSVDLQPGVMFISGESEGITIEVTMTFRAENGELVGEVLSAYVDGEEVPAELFGELNQGLSQSLAGNDVDYTVVNVTITEDEIIVEGIQE